MDIDSNEIIHVIILLYGVTLRKIILIKTTDGRGVNLEHKFGASLLTSPFFAVCSTHNQCSTNVL